MSECSNQVHEALQRELRMRREQQFIMGMKVIRLELTLIAREERVRELERSEWARLEEIE